MKNSLWISTALTLSIMLTACNQSGQDAQQKREIKPATKLTTDASKIAQDTYPFLLRAESVLTAQPVPRDELEQQIFQPIRQLLLRWNTEVKQSDSVVGDQHTICRGALISLGSWARSVQDKTASQANKQAIFIKQKNLCKETVQDAEQPNSLTRNLTQLPQ
jgi:hypothetical protein